MMLRMLTNASWRGGKNCFRAISQGLPPISNVPAILPACIIHRSLYLEYHLLCYGTLPPISKKYTITMTMTMAAIAAHLPGRLRASISPSAHLFADHHLTPIRKLTSSLYPCKSLICSSNLPRHRRRQLPVVVRRDMSVYGFGQQWTGALSRGKSALSLIVDEAPEISPEEIQQFGECQKMVPLRGIDDDQKCIAAAAGWGHTALLVEDRIKRNDDDDTNNNLQRKLLVCGRPHDFQTLMRLRRLPPFLRNFCIKYTLPDMEVNGPPVTSQLPPSFLQRIATHFAGDNETTFNEEECRRYSNVPMLLEVNLPEGEIPAVEGEHIDNRAHESHATGRLTRDKDNTHPSSSSSFHTRFQNTLATSAGVTAVISNTGTLYTFGLNHRGQCGSGSFQPNIWTPSRVSGLASARFILDHGTSFGDDMFRLFKEQQHPIVSVSLGLQHGVALDSEGQVFCWGKGERGQLGQGRRMVFEDNEIDNNENEYNQNDANDSKGEVPTENRTFDYALHVPNFHDPYSTILSSSLSSADCKAYAPLLSNEDSKVRLVAAGMNLSLAVTNSNLPYIWGKNVCLNPLYSESGLNSLRSKPVQDSTYPRYIPGLPPELRIERVSCGSHHAAMLLEDGSIWAVGVATDNTAPLWNEAVEILASGIINMNEFVSFTSGFDRTVAVSGRQVVEVQLWSNDELRQNGAVRPSWVDWLENEDGSRKVRSVHRGWLHSVIVTE